MRARYLVIIISIFLIGLFSVQNSIAHPPDLHEDPAPEQVQTVDEAVPHEQGKKTMDDHHAEGVETVAHNHASEGHDVAAGQEGGQNADQKDGHSHWGISPDSSPFSKASASIGKYHPLLVHFPIALFLTAAFAQVLNMRTKEGAYDKTVSLLVWCGAIGALVAGLLGWAHSGPVQTGENSVMSSHRWIGTLLLVGGIVLAYIMTKAASKDGGIRKNMIFNILLFGFAIAVAVQSFLGGALAHGGVKHLMPSMM